MNLLNTDPQVPVTITRGDRIAQLVVQQVARARFVVTDVLPGLDARDRRPRLHRGLNPARVVIGDSRLWSSATTSDVHQDPQPYGVQGGVGA